MANNLAKSPAPAPRRSHPGLAKAKDALDRARKSQAFQRAKAGAIRRRGVAVAAVAGAAYEYASQKMPIPKLPIPLSGEAQHAIIMAVIADNTRGMVQEFALATADGLAFSAGRRIVATGGIGAAVDDGEPVII